MHDHISTNIRKELPSSILPSTILQAFKNTANRLLARSTELAFKNAGQEIK